MYHSIKEIRNTKKNNKMTVSQRAKAKAKAYIKKQYKQGKEITTLKRVIKFFTKKLLQAQKIKELRAACPLTDIEITSMLIEGTADSYCVLSYEVYVLDGKVVHGDDALMSGKQGIVFKYDSQLMNPLVIELFN